MGLKASALPKLWIKHVEEAEQVGNAGTQRHQCIHIGRTMFRLLPCTDKETLAENKQDGGCQNQHDLIGVRSMHEKHADDHQGNGKKNGPDGMPAQLLVILLLYFLHLCKRGFLLFEKQVVSDLP